MGGAASVQKKPRRVKKAGTSHAALSGKYYGGYGSHREYEAAMEAQATAAASCNGDEDYYDEDYYDAEYEYDEEEHGGCRPLDSLDCDEVRLWLWKREMWSLGCLARERGIDGAQLDVAVEAALAAAKHRGTIVGGNFSAAAPSSVAIALAREMGLADEEALAAECARGGYPVPPSCNRRELGLALLAAHSQGIDPALIPWASEYEGYEPFATPGVAALEGAALSPSRLAAGSGGSSRNLGGAVGIVRRGGHFAEVDEVPRPSVEDHEREHALSAVSRAQLLGGRAARRARATLAAEAELRITAAEEAAKRAEAEAQEQMATAAAAAAAADAADDEARAAAVAAAREAARERAAAEAHRRQHLWTDPNFPPRESSLVYDGGACMASGAKHSDWADVLWRRGADAVDPVLFAPSPAAAPGDASGEAKRSAPGWALAAVSPTDVRQGRLGDCYFLSSLSALAEANDGARIRALFVSDRVDGTGKFVLRTFKNGVAAMIKIDDWIPCVPNLDPTAFGGYLPAFSKTSGAQGELWVALLEKAYAKLHGSFQRIESGDSAHALTDLTGAPARRYTIRGAADDVEEEEEDAKGCTDAEGTALELWPLLVEAHATGWVATAGTPAAEGDELSDLGLVPEHRYAIVNAVELPADTAAATHTGTRLIQVRNPWGKGEWKGAWSDHSPLWNDTTRRALIAAGGMPPTPDTDGDGTVSEAEAREADDGLFWIELGDFRSHFDSLSILHFYDHFRYSFVSLPWSRRKQRRGAAREEQAQGGGRSGDAAIARGVPPRRVASDAEHAGGLLWGGAIATFAVPPLDPSDDSGSGSVVDAVFSLKQRDQRSYPVESTYTYIGLRFTLLELLSDEGVGGDCTVVETSLFRAQRDLHSHTVSLKRGRDYAVIISGDAVPCERTLVLSIYAACDIQIVDAYAKPSRRRRAMGEDGADAEQSGDASSSSSNSDDDDDGGDGTVSTTSTSAYAAEVCRKALLSIRNAHYAMLGGGTGSAAATSTLAAEEHRRCATGTEVEFSTCAALGPGAELIHRRSAATPWGLVLSWENKSDTLALESHVHFEDVENVEAAAWHDLREEDVSDAFEGDAWSADGVISLTIRLDPGETKVFAVYATQPAGWKYSMKRSAQVRLSRTAMTPCRMVAALLASPTAQSVPLSKKLKDSETGAPLAIVKRSYHFQGGQVVVVENGSATLQLIATLKFRLNNALLAIAPPIARSKTTTTTALAFGTVQPAAVWRELVEGHEVHADEAADLAAATAAEAKVEAAEGGEGDKPVRHRRASKDGRTWVRLNLGPYERCAYMLRPRDESDPFGWSMSSKVKVEEVEQQQQD